MPARVVIWAVTGLLLVNSIVSADIYQWEYIDPAQPELGKQQSLTLCPDGAGASAVPQANLDFRNLTQAYLIGSDLTGASFYSATLTDADMTNAVVNGASFCSTTGKGFTAAQLYSTASYAGGDLTGIGLSDNDLTGWNFASKDLDYAEFCRAVVKGANFGDTTRQGFTVLQLYSTASYTSGDLTGIGLSCNDLTEWNFSGERPHQR